MPKSCLKTTTKKMAILDQEDVEEKKETLSGCGLALGKPGV